MNQALNFKKIETQTRIKLLPLSKIYDFKFKVEVEVEVSFKNHK